MLSAVQKEGSQQEEQFDDEGNLVDIAARLEMEAKEQFEAEQREKIAEKREEARKKKAEAAKKKAEQEAQVSFLFHPLKL